MFTSKGIEANAVNYYYIFTKNSTEFNFKLAKDNCVDIPLFSELSTRTHFFAVGAVS